MCKGCENWGGCRFVNHIGHPPPARRAARRRAAGHCPPRLRRTGRPGTVRHEPRCRPPRFRRLLPAGRTRRPRQNMLERGLPLSGRYGRRRRAVPLRTDPAPSEKTWFEPPQRLLHGYVERRGHVLPAGLALSGDLCGPRTGRRVHVRRNPPFGPQSASDSAVRNPRHRRPDDPLGRRPRQRRGLGRLCLRPDRGRLLGRQEQMP